MQINGVISTCINLISVFIQKKKLNILNILNFKIIQHLFV